MIIDCLKSRWLPWTIVVIAIVGWSATIGWFVSDNEYSTEANERTIQAIDDYWNQAISIEVDRNKQLEIVAKQAAIVAGDATERERDTLNALNKERRSHAITRIKLVQELDRQSGSESDIHHDPDTDSICMSAGSAYELAEARERCDGSLMRCRASNADFEVRLSDAVIVTQICKRDLAKCGASLEDCKEIVKTSEKDRKKAILTGVGYGAGGLAVLESIAAIIAVIVIFVK